MQRFRGAAAGHGGSSFSLTASAGNNGFEREDGVGGKGSRLQQGEVEMDREATAALLMLNCDRRGTISGGNGNGNGNGGLGAGARGLNSGANGAGGNLGSMSVRDLLSG